MDCSIVIHRHKLNSLISTNGIRVFIFVPPPTTVSKEHNQSINRSLFAAINKYSVTVVNKHGQDSEDKALTSTLKNWKIK